MRVIVKRRHENEPSDSASAQKKSIAENTLSSGTPANPSEANVSAQVVQGDNAIPDDNIEKGVLTIRAILLGAIASIGGFMFGYESGQISGMLQTKILIANLLTYPRISPDV